MKATQLFLFGFILSLSTQAISLPKGIYMSYYQEWKSADKFEPGYNFIDSDSTGAYFGYYKGGYVVEKFKFNFSGDTLTMDNYFNTSKEIFDASCKSTPQYQQQWTIKQVDKTTYHLVKIEPSNTSISSDEPYVLKWVSDLHR